MPDASNVHRQVRDLKRKHEEEAVLRNDGEEGSSAIFWSKKIEQDIKHDKAIRVDDNTIRREREAELERVRARREQNEAEFARRQDDIGDLERLRLAAEAMKESAKEEVFHLKQSIGRARKRLDEDRAQPIDVLVQVVYLQESHPLDDPHFQPHHVFNGFRSEDLHTLLEEVELFQSLDVEQAEHVKYWKNVVGLMRMRLEDELAATGAVARATEAAGMDQPHVTALVEEALQGTTEELEELQDELHAELSNPQCADPDFWRAVHAKLERRKAEKALEDVCHSKRDAARASMKGEIPHTGALATASAPEGPEDDEEGDGGVPEWLEHSDGRFSPPLLPADAVAGDILDEDDDREMLLALRAQAQQEAEQAAAQLTTVPSRPAAAADHGPGDAAMSQALAAMGDNPAELNFRGVVPLAAQEYWWREQYAPRQPKFFNKVHTGYDWNKYNRAHYDQDNPPPKVVQGYKFNIFYPDLIDKLKAPTYKILTDPTGDDSTVILQFCAGAPYEDVAFRIVNKEWDRGPKKGFRNVFDRCMLQLYFSFKRTPYKR